MAYMAPNNSYESMKSLGTLTGEPGSEDSNLKDKPINYEVPWHLHPPSSLDCTVFP